MWLFTKSGFYSCVSFDKGATVTIRARVKEDLENLMELPQWYIPLGIINTPKKDYPFRATVTKSDFETIMRLLSDQVDYPNFKAMILQVFGKVRHDIYAHVWAVMIEIEQKKRNLFGKF